MSRTMHFAPFCYGLPLAFGWPALNSHPRLMRVCSDRRAYRTRSESAPDTILRLRCKPCKTGAQCKGCEPFCRTPEHYILSICTQLLLLKTRDDWRVKCNRISSANWKLYNHNTPFCSVLCTLAVSKIFAIRSFLRKIATCSCFGESQSQNCLRKQTHIRVLGPLALTS